MATLYHAPQSRSRTIIALLHELGDPADIIVRQVTIPRVDGSGRPDPENPHPEKKVPYLVDNDEHIRERGAIIAYLTDKFPSSLAPLPGQPGRGEYLSWLFWYQGVLEPVMIFDWSGIAHPMLDATFRDLPTAISRLEEALTNRPYLLGESYSAADLLLSSPFHFFPAMVPGTGPLPDWVERCASRDAQRRAAAGDAL